MSDVQINKQALNETLASLANLRIDPSRVRFKDTLGSFSGGYGDVRFATLVPDGNGAVGSFPLVAVKQLRPIGSDMQRLRLATRLARELKVWAGLSHPNILPLVGFHLDDSMTAAWLLSPFVTRGNVMEYISHARPSAEKRLQLATDTIRGLAYLHQLDPPICHGDLKAANVLVTSKLQAVLCDFGLAKVVEGSSGLTTSDSFSGSIRYMAPELLLDDAPLRTFWSDIWAWACLLYEILTGKLPFERVTNDIAVIHKISSGALPVDLDEDSELQLADCVLLRKCWALKPDERPSASQCLRAMLNRHDLRELLGNPKVAPLAVKCEGPGWSSISNPQLDSRLEVDLALRATFKQAVVSKIRFSPDGALLAIALQSEVHLVDRKTGRLIRVLDETSSPRTSTLERFPQVLPGKPLLSQSSLDYNSETDKSTIKYLTFDTKGEHIAASTESGLIRIWSLASGNCTRLLLPAEHRCLCLEAAPDADGFAICDAVYFWRLSVTGSLHSCRPLPIEGSNHTLAVCMSSDGTLIASSYTDASVTLWDPRPGGKLRRLPQQAASMFSLSFCDNEHRLVTYGVDKTVAFWSLGEELPIARKLEDLPLPSIRCIASMPGSTMVAVGSFDSNIYFLDTTPAAMQGVVIAHQQPIVALDTTAGDCAGSVYLASADLDGSLRIWRCSIGDSFL